jgi:DNA polymerase-3 subunit epsilon
VIPRLRSVVATLRHRLAIRREGWRETTVWSLDLETGGLDAATDPILSVGMVPIRDGVIALGDALHTLVRPDTVPGEASLTVHHILARDLGDAPPLPDVLPGIARRIDGGVLLVHQRRIDIPFLHQAFRRCDLELPVFAVVDTVDLLLRYARRHGLLNPERPSFPTGLADARARFGLPPHRAHEALSDAVATAELFLVLAHRLEATRLSQLL